MVRSAERSLINHPAARASPPKLPFPQPRAAAPPPFHHPYSLYIISHSSLWQRNLRTLLKEPLVLTLLASSPAYLSTTSSLTSSRLPENKRLGKFTFVRRVHHLRDVNIRWQQEHHAASYNVLAPPPHCSTNDITKPLLALACPHSTTFLFL